MGAFAVMFTRFRVFLFVVGAGAVLIALDEMSGFLGNVAGSDGSSASMDVLTRPHFGLSPITAAVAAWGSSGSQHLAANLIIWSLIADVFFMGVYGFVLYKIIEWATDGMPTRTKNLYWGLAATIAADVVEDVASFAIHASVYHAHSAPTAWVVVAVVATWLKWVSLVLTVLIALAMRLAQPAAALPVGYSGMSPHQKLHAQAGALVAALPAPSSRIWTRLRVQLACSLIFGTLIAYPGGGALDQVTDTIRTLADGRHWQPALLARVVPVIALLCPALWFGGRLALLDDRVDQLRKKPHSPRFVLVVGAALAAVYTLARLADGPDFALRAVGGYGLPFVAGGVLALVAICTHKWPWDKSRDALGRIDAPIGLNRGQVRDAVLIITVMPIAAFGLGVMRAFLLDAFVSGSSTAFWITITGLTIAVGGTAGVFYGLKAVEGPLFGDTRSGNVPPAVSRFRLLVGLQVVLGAGVVVAALGLAIDPLDFAKPFHAVGVVATFVATLAFLGGIAQWCSEVRTPMLVFRKLHFRRGPIVILATAVFVVAGFLNAGARYHDVRMARDTAAVTARSLADEVDSWADQAVTCAGARFSDGSIPMVFVAAPGGGIRAAFWTDHALAAIERTLMRLEDDETLIALEELVQRFSIERVSLNPAQFDEAKLRWMNGRYLRELPVEELQRRIEALSGREVPREAVEISQEKMQTLADFWPLAGFLVDRPDAYDQKAWDKVMVDGSVERLEAARQAIEAAEPFGVESVEAGLRGLVERLGVKPKEVFQPIRVALTGTTVSPGIFESVAALGREEALARIDAALERARAGA